MTNICLLKEESAGEYQCHLNDLRKQIIQWLAIMTQKKKKSYIMYLDANNLYGWAMSQALPTGGFEWVKDCNELEKTIISHSSDSDKSYILEVDLEYPHELHDTHNAYPLAPEKIKVKDEWFSEYQKKSEIK